nr:MAG TPA: hypothetical protein [Caudoviricetes sp.]
MPKAELLALQLRAIRAMPMENFPFHTAEDISSSVGALTLQTQIS